MTTALARLARIAATAVLVVGFGLGLVGTASAHDVLVSSDPVDGSTVAVAPSVITFTFDQPVQNFDPVVSLIGPDGRQYVTVAPTITGNVVSGTVGAGPAGAYVAAYRIVSADGHPVTGQVKFTLAGDEGAPSGAVATAPAGASPPPTAGAATGGSPVASSGESAAGPSQGASAAPPGSSSGGLSTGLWIALAVAALVIIAAAVLLLRRPGRAGSGSKRDKAY